MSRHHMLMLVSALTTALPLTGFARTVLRQANDDGTYCFRVNNKSKHPTCTVEAIPPAAVEAQAKLFQPDAQALTVYVVRNRWSDASNLVDLSVDSRRVTSTVPNSFVRLRLAPGPHRLAMTWDGHVIDGTVAGDVGDIKVVVVVGSAGVGPGSYRLEPSDLASSSRRIQASRLVADLNLQGPAR